MRGQTLAASGTTPSPRPAACDIPGLWRAHPGQDVEQAQATAIVRIERQERVHEQTEIGPVADRTQAAHPPSMMLKVDLARILEDQNVPAPGTTGQRALSQAGSELIGSKMTVGEEAGVGHLLGPRRRQLTNPSGRLVDHASDHLAAALVTAHIAEPADRKRL